MPAQFRLYLVRHGETEWNRIRRIQGQLDVPLNEAGLRQSMFVADSLRDIPFVKAFSSDLQRASKTAECILRYHPDITLEEDELIRERYMGELQGKIGSSKQPAESVETMPNLAARCLLWYSKSIMDYLFSMIEAGPSAQQSHDVLVVSHGAWIATLLSALWADGRLICREGVEIGHIQNSGVSIIEYADIPSGKDEVLVGTLVQYSDVAHLTGNDLHTLKANPDVIEDSGRT